MASARLRLSAVADIEDAQRAIDLVSESLRSCQVMDAEGRIDGMLLAGGISTAQADRIRLAKQLVNDLSKERDETDRVRGWARHADVVERCVAAGLSSANAEAALAELVRSNQVYKKGGEGTYAILRA